MNDYIIRATAAEDCIRIFAATTKNLVQKAHDAHNTSNVATAALGRLLTGGAIMGSMLKNETDVMTGAATPMWICAPIESGLKVRTPLCSSKALTVKV